MEFPESIQHTQVVGCAVVSAGCIDRWDPAAPDARQRTSMSQRVHGPSVSTHGSVTMLTSRCAAVPDGGSQTSIILATLDSNTRHC